MVRLLWTNHEKRALQNHWKTQEKEKEESERKVFDQVAQKKKAFNLIRKDNRRIMLPTSTTIGDSDDYNVIALS